MKRLLPWSLGAAAAILIMVVARLAWAPPTGSTPAATGPEAPPAESPEPSMPEPEPIPQVADGTALYRTVAEERDLALGPADKSYVMQLPRPVRARGIYISGLMAATPGFDRLVELVERTELNAVVIDVKNDWGDLTYRSQFPGAVAAGVAAGPIQDLPGMLARLNERGIYPIARIVTFKDDRLPRARPELGVQHVGGGLWRDNKGITWLDPYQQETWDYVIGIAREAAAMGFKEIQFDYVRFPTDGNMAAVRYAEDGRPKWEVIAGFLAYAREQLRPYGVLISADIFGYILTTPDDQNIGQRLESLAGNVDIICPMIYPSHWGPGNLGLPNPNADPYQTVLRSMRHARRRLEQAGIEVVIRPWLQDFTLGHPPYTAEHVRAQIQATYDAGLEEWLLWNAANRYTEGALLPGT